MKSTLRRSRCAEASRPESGQPVVLFAMPKFTRTVDCRSRRLLMLVATILCAAGASSAADPYSFTERWRWVHFTMEDGLPSNRILDVCEAQDGTTWVSTASGLAWYDGYVWHALGPEEGMPRAACRRITADTGSGVLTVVDGKLYRGDRNMFEQVFIPGQGRIVLIGRRIADRRWTPSCKTPGVGGLTCWSAGDSTALGAA